MGWMLRQNWRNILSAEILAEINREVVRSIGASASLELSMVQHPVVLLILIQILMVDGQ